MTSKIVKYCIISLFLGALGSNVFADSVAIVKIETINSASKFMIASDAMIHFSKFTIIQKQSSSKNERLPFSSVKVGDWVALTLEHSEKLDGFLVKKLVMLPDEKTARKLQSQLDVDD